MRANFFATQILDRLVVHREQLATLRHATPAAMWGYAINVTVAFWAFNGIVPLNTLGLWALLSYGLCATIGWRAARKNKQHRDSPQDQRVSISSVVFAVLLALPWSFLAVRYAGAMGGESEIVLIALAIGMAASGSILLAPVPQAAIIYQSVILLPLVAKSVFFLPTKQFHVLGLLGASFWAFLVALILTTAKLFSERMRAAAELRNSVIALNDAHREAEVAATTDALTGLANRRAFVSRLEAPSRHSPTAQPYALIYLDLDGFKDINDALGHAIGDELLQSVANRLEGLTRSQDFLARIGGDEFAIILEGIDNRAGIDRRVQRFVDELRKPHVVDGRPLNVSASVGVALSAECESCGGELLKHADLAMYSAKAARDCVRYFEPVMERRAVERHGAESRLREAIRRRAFSLYFQPIRDLTSGKITTLEALIRWPQDDGSIRSPDEFLPLVESLGFCDEVGEWVINEACTHAVKWPREVVVAVNVSPNQILSGKLFAQVEMALLKTGLPPQRLQLEITEASLLHDTPRVHMTMERLRARGVSIALDDFGSGYSSLSYLVSFPFDRIKLDRQFIAPTKPRESWTIVRAVVGLAKTLNCTVVAEGIETADQLEHLRAIGVSDGQGYLLGRPQASTDILNLLKGRDAYRLSMPRVESAQLNVPRLKAPHG